MLQEESLGAQITQKVTLATEASKDCALSVQREVKVVDDREACREGALPVTTLGKAEEGFCS